MMEQREAEQIAREWLTAMHGYVRAVDYTGARVLFHDDVVGFGTYSGILDGLDQLMAEQWQQVWGTITGFTFLVEQLRAGGDGAVIWAICPWDSQGRRDDGSTFPRPGRVTVILTNRGDGWKAAHTHFSLYPPTAKR